jgi:hypothetical protein
MQTMRKRMRAKLAEIKEEMRHRLHQRIAEQGKPLKGVVTGCFAYHAVPTNVRSIWASCAQSTAFWSSNATPNVSTTACLSDISMGDAGDISIGDLQPDAALRTLW